MARKRMYATTFTSLKKLFDQTVEEGAEAKGVEGKEKCHSGRKDKETLQEHIEQQFKLREGSFDIYRDANDTDGFWKNETTQWKEGA